MHRLRSPGPSALLVSLLCVGAAAGQTRVACLGDSITFGARVEDREHNAWPVQLAALLGGGFEVRNFGVGGATLLRAADTPYVRMQAWRDALAFAPEIAIVSLGTNDTCQDERRKNWQHEQDLERDAAAMVAALRERKSGVRVLLASPTGMFAEQASLEPSRRDDLRERAPRLARIGAALRAVAAGDSGVEYLELGRTLRVEHVTDGVHTTSFGAERIARRVAEALATPRVALPALVGGLAAKGIAARAGAFEEFATLELVLPETRADCRVVVPFGAAPGLPWIWRARFFGHQPALDLALLERGFHLVYCDVADLYGGPEAMRRWDECYALLREFGLGPRAVLEGMSRGGLPIVNWAARHPERVAAIYGDNPVADFRSWPGGRSGKRSDADWQRCLEVYGLDEQSALHYREMPVDRLAPIAAARVPLLLVMGTADDVVPPAENGELLAQRYAGLGGPVQVWRKAGVGHHPHGLDPVDPLLRHVLRAAGFPAMPSATPARSAETRGGAGYAAGSWSAEVARLKELVAARPVPVAFLGDSITQGLTGAVNRFAEAGGKRAFDRAFGELGAISLGLSGDRTEHVLWRIEHGALAVFDPRVVVLQIGVNNVVAAQHTVDEVRAGIAAVLAALRTREPQARVLLCGPFPAGAAGSTQRTTIDVLYAQLPELVDGDRVRLLDLRGLFVAADGAPTDKLSGDLVHITPAGQEAWLAAVRPVIDELLR
ncbi:MAG: prolyl oligopeptidase family serine peptidase [Planctomycetes bacterium]|nr:prolyl oligopeptidase family serine peptidase [Planctomycetota bacterium]